MGMRRLFSKQSLQFRAAVMLIGALTVSCASPDRVLKGSTDLTEHRPAEIIISANGDSERVEAQGYANLELSVAASSQSVFRIASLTKQFTAVAILSLVEDDRLSLEDRLSTLLPTTPAEWGGITVRQLLSHTSGLSSDLSPVLKNFRKDFSPNDLVALYFEVPMASAPGEEWRYSNLNFWLLGLIIEKTTGKSYPDFVAERVLARAGLQQTQYGDYLAVIPNRVASYEIDDQEKIHNARYFSTTIGYSAGGFVSSPADMAKWYRALGEGKILSKETLGIALTPAQLNDGVTANYGLGWYVEDIDGVRVGHHGGSSIGFMSYIYWAPESGKFAGVFRNWSDAEGEPKDVARQALQEVMGSE